MLLSLELSTSESNYRDESIIPVLVHLAFRSVLHCEKTGAKLFWEVSGFIISYFLGFMDQRVDSFSFQDLQ